MTDYLTFSDAIKNRRLDEFVEQEEMRGIGLANAKDLDRAFCAASQPITQKQPTGRTSRSPSRDGSAGKRTR